MIRMICGKSVQGDTHKRMNKPCQDCFQIEEQPGDVILLTVADGHGSCPLCQEGAEVAVKVFRIVMKAMLRVYKGKTQQLMTFLKREGAGKFAKTIEKEWKQKVLEKHINSNRDFPLKDNKADLDTLYKLYGTTILGLCVTPDFIFGFQIGDGDILYIQDGHAEQIVEGDKLLGTSTYSISEANAWKRAKTNVWKRDAEREAETATPALYWLSSDGFANAYGTTPVFMAACEDYYNFIMYYGFDVLRDNLETYLNETSIDATGKGSGDDVTLLLLCIAPDGWKPQMEIEDSEEESAADAGTDESAESTKTAENDKAAETDDATDSSEAA